MLHCLEEPIDQLKELLRKLDNKDRRPDLYCPECDYLDSQVNDKEKFINCIEEAIKKIEEAYQHHVERINSSYPDYTPLRELEWVTKEEFEEWKGKKLETELGSHALFIIRYENGEEYLSEGGSKYGLYV